MELPNELTYRILLNSSYNDIIKWCDVGGIFYDICEDNIFWKQKLIKDYPEYMHLYDEESNLYRQHYEQSMNNYFWRNSIEDEYPEFLHKAEAEFSIKQNYEDYYYYLIDTVFQVPIYLNKFNIDTTSHITLPSWINELLGYIRISGNDNYFDILDRIADTFKININDYDVSYYIDQNPVFIDPYSFVSRHLDKIKLTLINNPNFIIFPDNRGASLGNIGFLLGQQFFTQNH